MRYKDPEYQAAWSNTLQVAERSRLELSDVESLPRHCLLNPAICRGGVFHEEAWQYLYEPAYRL